MPALELHRRQLLRERRRGGNEESESQAHQ